jgi:hypothetical protein
MNPFRQHHQPHWQKGRFLVPVLLLLTGLFSALGPARSALAATTPLGLCPNGTARTLQGDTNCDGLVRIAVLGDGQAAGEGAGPAYVAATNSARNRCHRSTSGWVTSIVPGLPTADVVNFDSTDPREVLPANARAGQSALLVAACSGADSSQFYQSQDLFDAKLGLNRSQPAQRTQLRTFRDAGAVDIVVVGFGAEDARLRDLERMCVVGNCVEGSALQSAILDRTVNAARKVRQVLLDVKSEVSAPNQGVPAEVYVTSYANPFLSATSYASCAGATIATRAYQTELPFGSWVPLSDTAGHNLAIVSTLAGRASQKIVPSAGGARLTLNERNFLGDNVLPNLNEFIKRAANEVGANFVDVANSLANRSVCDPSPVVNRLDDWTDPLNGAVTLSPETFMPTTAGHLLIAQTFSTAVGGALGNHPNPAAFGALPGEIVAPHLTIADRRGAIGGATRPPGEFSIELTGVKPSATYRIVVGRVPVSLGTLTTNGLGEGAATLAMPFSMPPGVQIARAIDIATEEAITEEFMLVDATEGCGPTTPTASGNVDGDLLPDACDPDRTDGPAADRDGDGVVNGLDLCPLVASNSAGSQADADFDDVGDQCDQMNGGASVTPPIPISSLYVNAIVPRYVGLAPARLFDSRVGQTTVDSIGAGGGRLAAGSTTVIQITGRGGVPLGAKAAALNVTAVFPSSAGYLSVFPCGSQRPNASNVNYVGSDVVPNAVITELDGTGTICVYTSAATDLIVDVNGTSPIGSDFSPRASARLYETRLGNATADGLQAQTGTRSAGSVSIVKIAGRGGIVRGASTAALNITVTGTQAAGYVTVYPCDAPRPTASNLNFAAGQTVANLVMAKMASDGTVCVYTSAALDLIVDVSGFIGGSSSYVSLQPARLLETRPASSGTTIDGLSAAGGLRLAGTTTEVAVHSRGGVPATADTVVVNVTVTGPAAAGFVTVFPCGSARPNSSTLNFAAGATVANASFARVGSAGKICLYTSVDTHLVLDVNGAFVP